MLVKKNSATHYGPTRLKELVARREYQVYTKKDKNVYILSYVI